MTKKILAGLVFVMASGTSWSAGGTWDGIYTCDVDAQGARSQAYVTVNGQPDGRAVFAVAAVAPSQTFYGYGIGNVVGSGFRGQTDLGAPFSMSATTSGFTGSIGVYYAGRLVNVAANCIKIW